MTLSSVKTASSAQAAPSRQGTLAELAGIVASHAGGQMMAMAGRMADALLGVAPAGIDPGAARQRLASGQLLKNNAYAFVHLASSAFERAIGKQLAELAPGDAARPALSGALSLVPLEEMDDKVAFGAVTRPFDIAHSEPLATLGVRLGFLLGRDMLRAEQNPFRPEVLLGAIRDAWREFEPEPAAHDLILALLRPQLVFDFAPLYEALNLALVRKAGHGGGRAIQKTDGSAAAAAARASQKAALAQQLRQFFNASDALQAAQDDIPLIPDLPNMPRGGGGWRPSGAAGFAEASSGAQEALAPGQPSAPGRHSGAAGQPEAAGWHSGAAGQPAASGWHTGEAGGAGLARHAGAAAGGMAAGAPAGAPLLELLSRLQPGLNQPPAGHAGQGDAAQPHEAAQPHNVFYLPRLKQSLPPGSLSRSDESTLDLLSRIFETVFLDDSIPKETRELIQFLQVPVLKAALRDQNFFFEDAHPARRMIDLMSRMGWEQRHGAGDAMLQAMRRSVGLVGPEHAEHDFAQAVAELEQSIAAQESAAEAAIAEPISQALRQEKRATAARAAGDAVALRVGGGEVVAVVGAFLQNKWTEVLTLAYSVEDDKPGAVENATRVMDDLIWSVKPKATQEQRKGLIKRLPGLLAALNKWLDVIKWQDAERLQFFASLAQCHASIVRAPIEASPARQLELAVEAAQQDALRRVAQETAAAQAAQAPRDPAEVEVDALERGMWLAFAQPEGGVRKLKLAWVSPLRSLFIFSGAARQDAFSMPAEKLAEAFRAGTASLVAFEGVVGRVLTQAMEQAGANDPPPAAHAALG